MQWSEVIAPPSANKLRQFGVLCFLFFVGLGLWRFWHGHTTVGSAMVGAGLVLGGLGLVRPTALGPIYQGWMIAAFPIGWTISRVMLGCVFLLVFTPMAAVFRLIGRDALRLTPRRAGASYWTPRPTRQAADYLRQF